MSLVGFKAQNHPQQKAKDSVDDRAITLERWVRKAWDQMHAFTPHNGSSAWCHFCEPSGDEGWCAGGYGAPRAELVVMLVPANRTEQGWWQRQVEPFRREGTLTVEFLPGRMRFLCNGADAIKPNERPPFGCCLLIWGAS